MNDAVVVDQILRSGLTPRDPLFLGLPTEHPNQACRIGSMSVSLGDASVGPTRWTGGLVPYARVTVPEDDAVGGFYPAKVLFQKVIPAATGLSSFATLTTTGNLEARLDLPFRVFAVCASEALSIAYAGSADWSTATDIELGAQPIEPTNADGSAIGTAVREVARYLPSWSQKRLADMFGVSRQSWRDWYAGRAQPRGSRRGQLLQVTNALRTRESAVGDPEAWFETPIWPGRTDTPESLIRDGREGLVAALALRVVPSPIPSKLGPFVDRDLVEQDLMANSTIYAPTFDDE
jgi:hypothetical protein